MDEPLGDESVTVSRGAIPLSQIDHRVIPPVDVAALRRADLLSSSPKLRVAQAVPVDLTLANAGTTEILPDGSTLWQLRVSARGAVFVSFTASDFWLPPGATLSFRSVEREYVTGPYTEANNHPMRRFGSPAIPVGPDGTALVELRTLPDSATPVLNLETVSYGYRDFRGFWRVPYRDGRAIAANGDPAAEATCEVDINCPEGTDWQDDKRAVAEIYDGTFVCTGSMLNNVREDCTNYFLTANHCVKSKGKASSLVFYWNYENSACGLNDAPIDQTSVGSYLRATTPSSDFTLLELTADPDPSYYVYHTGWNRSATAASSGVTIHHPNDLPKKISFENDPLHDGGDYSDGWGSTHWRVTGWDIGTTEPGSSGSGLWNDAHQIVGQLTGGTGDCSGGWDEYGKLAVSWDLGLSTWLDPDGSGAISVNGKNCVGGTPPPPPPPCELGQVGDPCSSDADCCSNTCRGPSGNKTCKG